MYKALEGIAYSLINNPNPTLEKKADEWIDNIAAAQQPDGYWKKGGTVMVKQMETQTFGMLVIIKMINL